MATTYKTPARFAATEDGGAGALLADAHFLAAAPAGGDKPFAVAGMASQVFINEFHYDNDGADVGERIEIAAPAGTNISGFSVVLYNGSGGAAYNTSLLTATNVVKTTANGVDFYVITYPSNGIQNGAPDGIALVSGTTVIQFLSYEGTFAATSGPASGMTSTDVGRLETGTEAAGLSLQLTGTGDNAGDFTYAGPVANSFGAANTGQTISFGAAPPPPPAGPGAFSINDVAVTEGDAGTTALTFTVIRDSGAGAVSVDFSRGTASMADAADFAPGQVFAGTLNFADGQTSATVTFQVAGDMVNEPNEELGLVLSNATGGATIADPFGLGTIRNDDAPLTPIFTIQGEGHRSALAGTTVTTSGFVTAIANNGFYLQDPAGDGNVRTSDALFVFTSSAPTVTVGQAVRVAGSVAEFVPGATASNPTNNLSTTQINATSVTPTGTGTVAATLIGTGGRTPPTTSYGDDDNATFDPATEGLDFFETLEGMLVTVQAPRVLNQGNGSDEVQVLASGGAQATGVNARGGITVLPPNDFNPERIQLDDSLLPAFEPGTYSQGDILNDVTGIVAYNFQSFEVLVTALPTVRTDAPPLPLESTNLRGTADRLSIASYNVQNLSAVDSQRQFDQLGQDIANRLGAPDIVGLSEIQDADGAGMGADTSGAATAARLIDAIVAAGGPRYEYIEVAPAANTTGGEPGGNIRNGFLYNPLRVDYVEGSAVAIDGPAYTDTRRPLAADFLFNGETVTAIAVHFTSRGGSDGLGGAQQPPNNEGDDRREAQAQGVRDYLDGRAAVDPEANFITVGDFNAFYFEPALGNLQNGPGGQRNLYDLLAPEERYTFLFDGNLQPLDNILVSPNLRFGAELDAVHLNAEQPSSVPRPSDHDPLVATVRISLNDVFQGSAGNDTLRSGAGDDVFLLMDGGDDTADGGAGNDTFLFGGALTVADIVRGGEGTNDQLGIQGDYSGGRMVRLGDVTGVEVFVISSGENRRFGLSGNDRFDYGVITDDRNVAAGATLQIDANALRAGEDLFFDGRAETDGAFFVFAGLGTDTIIGGAGIDLFLFREAGAFTGADTIDGSGGRFNDIVLRADHTGANAVVFGETTIANITTIGVRSGADGRFGPVGERRFSYDLTSADGNVAAGGVLSVDGGTLVAGESLRFIGSAETNGSFRLFGGDGGDTLVGGRGDDLLRGNRGADLLDGGAGADRFEYRGVEESTAAARDTLRGFEVGVDRIDLSRIDASAARDGNDAFTFIGEGAFTGRAGELRVGTDASGARIVEGDTNGDGIADLSIFVDAVQPLTANDFIL